MWVVKKLILAAGFLVCAYMMLNRPMHKVPLGESYYLFQTVTDTSRLVGNIGATLFITAAAYVLAGFLDRKRPRVIDAEPVAGELVRR